MKLRDVRTFVSRGHEIYDLTYLKSAHFDKSLMIHFYTCIQYYCIKDLRFKSIRQSRLLHIHVCMPYDLRRFYIKDVLGR